MRKSWLSWNKGKGVQKIAGSDFRDHFSSGLFTLKLNLPDHELKYLKAFGNLPILEASLYEW